MCSRESFSDSIKMRNRIVYRQLNYVKLSYSIEIIENLNREIGDCGSTVVKVLCYKSEGRWFDSRWCHWIFPLT
jgi:hypothetical protein